MIVPLLIAVFPWLMTSPLAETIIFREQPFVDRVITELVVRDQPQPGGDFVVQLRGQSTRSGEKNPKPLSGMMIQAWLLRSNGTVLAQRHRVSGGVSSGGYDDDMLTFGFEHVPRSEVVGIVVLVNGNLLVRALHANDRLR
jgi:hypothetical protein